MGKYNTLNEFTQSLQKSIKDAGTAALAIAKAKCPIQSGDLYNSLYVEITSTGFILGATVPYASDVEEGREAELISGTYKTTRKRHTRTSKNGVRFKVAAHSITYNGSRPIQFGTEWATVSEVIRREGTHFMENASMEAIEQVMGNMK